MTSVIAEPLGSASPAACPVEVYESGLEAQHLWVHDRRGRRESLPVAGWSGVMLPGDESLLARCLGPTLDIGCGPGRLVAALAAAGEEALGIDISAAAIARARAAGGKAVRRSVFGPVPEGGRWEVALLADGNIGIGGDPLALLERTRELVAPGGVILIEVDGPGQETFGTTIRLQDLAGRLSHWFPWAQVGIDGVEQLARGAGLEVTDGWQSAGRWFAGLRRQLPAVS